MTVTITSTTKIVELNGVPCRIWEGLTERGVPMHAYIARVAVANDADASQFEQELKEQRAPSPALEGIPLRMII